MASFSTTPLPESPVLFSDDGVLLCGELLLLIYNYHFIIYYFDWKYGLKGKTSKHNPISFNRVHHKLIISVLLNSFIVFFFSIYQFSYFATNEEIFR